MKGKMPGVHSVAVTKTSEVMYPVTLLNTKRRRFSLAYHLLPNAVKPIFPAPSKSILHADYVSPILQPLWVYCNAYSLTPNPLPP